MIRCLLVLDLAQTAMTLFVVLSLLVFLDYWFAVLPMLFMRMKYKEAVKWTKAL